MVIRVCLDEADNVLDVLIGEGSRRSSSAALLSAIKDTEHALIFKPLLQVLVLCMRDSEKRRLIVSDYRKVSVQRACHVYM